MKLSLLTAAACAGLALSETTGKLGNAAITENNPSNVAYEAQLPTTGNGPQGTIEGVSNTNGTGDMFNVNFFGFPAGGPFSKQLSSAPIILTSRPANPFTSLSHSRRPSARRWQLLRHSRPS